MNSTHDKINETLNEYNSIFSKNECYPIQKAYTTPHFLVLMIRVPGKTLAMYIGRGNQYIGVFIEDKAPPAFLRIQDKFLDFVRRHLVGAKIGKLQLIVEKNIEYIKFDFKTDVFDNSFCFGYNNRELFFTLREKELTFCSWNNQILKDSKIEFPDSDVRKHYFVSTIEQYLKNETQKSNGVIVIKKRTKFLQKKIENIKKDLELNSAWAELEELLKNEQINLNTSEFIFKGHRFNLLGLRTDWEKKDFIFKKIKKLKRGEILLRERLKETEIEYSQTASGEMSIPTTKEKAIQVLWKTGPKSKNSMPNSESNIVEFHMLKLTGMIGLNASGNDQMRTRAKKDFYWFHIENYPGAHCILKTDDISQLTAEMFELIASILRDYSKLEILEIPLMFTQVKNIKGIKGTKGEVSVNKAKYLVCPYRNWKEIISIV